MADLHLTLPPEQMQALLSEAILAQLTPEVQKQIIKDALTFLLAPTRGGGYGSGKTPLQEAYENAASRVATKVAEEKLVKDPEFIENVEGVIAEAAQKAFFTDREATVKRVADAIVSGLDNSAKRY